MTEFEKDLDYWYNTTEFKKGTVTSERRILITHSVAKVFYFNILFEFTKYISSITGLWEILLRKA